ncbi:MAG: OmpH family outer membrane protein [Chlorobi bacterium]|nr:OmpH family outer membrane protein [Chlorobiota bacterium]
MKRLFSILSSAVLIIASVFLSDCKNENTGNGAAAGGNTGSFKVAVVKTDTLAEVYEYYNDLQTELMLEQQDKEADLSARYKSLQTKFLKIQRDLQNRMITPTSAKKKQEQLALEQQKLQQDQQNYQAEMMDKSQKMTLQILDSIKNYLKIYNKDHNYDMILTSDTLGTNILLYDKAMDITSDIVKGLNKRYREATGKKNDEKEN